MTRRRSKRSVRGPAARPTTRLGAERAAKMAPTIPLDPVKSKTSHPRMTCCIPWPIWLMKVEAHSIRMVGERMGSTRRP